MIAYCASDLVWATRIKAAAEDLGIQARPVRNLEMLNARLADSPVRGLIVDLDAHESALPILRRAREWEREGSSEGFGRRRIRIIAFGPHVETAALAEANACGADAALTRGAFSARLIDLLKELDAE